MFADDSFLSDLVESIQKLLNFSLFKGITIPLDGRKLIGQKNELLFSDSHNPYYAEEILGDVKYRIIAGL